MEETKTGPMIGGLKWLLDIIWYLLWAVLTVSAVTVLLATVLFGAQLFGWLPGGVATSLMGAVDRIIMLPLLVAEIVTLLVIVHRLRLIVRTLISGDPFVPENAGHLRIIAIAIGLYQIVRYAAQGLVAISLAVFGFRIGGVELTHFDLNLGPWFAVAALLVLSEVLREGARMRQEQKLTI
ncbi:DUF2975 domain-containing protein [Hyphobacterium indicum]|jgi:hypothetical protein|uniref:DUF2975 domain-containing protein n=1 Tax=Hyphobacterium indicum TaxID=2162714 RepID=UPI000D644F91|nr:DUF2975 domain-containing protein [Hyphobacterium indicum]MBI1236471.1 DUF2975 domain-containing protein [Alphaproteobacteria bacterium]